MKLLAIVGVFSIGALLVLAGAGGAIWYVGERPVVVSPVADIQPAESSGDALPDDAPPTGRSGAAEITYDNLARLLGLLETTRREAILASPDTFSDFVQQERGAQAVLNAAYANDADRDPVVSELMSRAAQNVLVDAYMEEVVRRNLSADYPSEEQVKAYFSNNKASLRLPDRVHLWQIFLPLPPGDSAAALENASALSRQLATNSRASKSTFAALVRKYSGHAPSRINDGYMGLLDLDDLLPEIRTVVDKLALGEISAPVRSEAGFHILKRGALVKGGSLEYPGAREEIVLRMRQEATTRVREAAVKKILETYPVALDGSALARWRQRLLARAWPGATAGVSDLR